MKDKKYNSKLKTNLKANDVAWKSDYTKGMEKDKPKVKKRTTKSTR